MQFESVLENVYVGNITDARTNNHIYRNLTKDGVYLVREVLEDNPYFEVVPGARHGLIKMDSSITRLENVEVDFSKIDIKDLFFYVFYCLGIDESLDFNSYQDLLLFIKVLNSNGRLVNLHIFNASLLDDRETNLLNDLIHLNLIGVGMQVYLEEGTSLKNELNENGEAIENGMDHFDIEVEAPKFTIKLKNNSLDYKAS